MEMPKSCWDCKFKHRITQQSFGGYAIVEYCFITKTDVYGHGKTRSQDCPLREVK